MWRYGVALALLPLALTACSDEHAGSLPPPPSPLTSSASPSATPTSAASAVEAAARAYYDVLTSAGMTGNTSALAAMIVPGCECAKTLDYLRREAAAGHRFTTVYRVDLVKTHDLTSSLGFATVTLSYAPSKIVDRSGRLVRSVPGKSKVGRDLGFKREGDRWVLTRLVVLGG